MKKSLFVILVFVFAISNSKAQYEPLKVSKETDEKVKPSRLYYVGLGSGIYSKFGIFGLGFGTRIAPFTLAEANFGLGFWGSKAGVSFTTRVNGLNGWCPSIGISRNSGFESLTSEVDVIYNFQEYKKQSANLKFNQINVLHVSMQRQFLNKKGNRFVLEIGYAIALNAPSVEFSEDNITLDGSKVKTSLITFTDEQKDFFNVQSPNGLLLSVGYQFGFGKNY